tara:strand:+ start:204 stop:338 length:135 start_codon:yes stop_codon:yes gene_type:complete
MNYDSNILNRIFKLIFAGPKLIRKSAPGKYEVVSSHRGGYYFLN